MREQRGKWAGCALALALAAVSVVRAQPPDGWLVDRWTAADGLPVNSVRHIHIAESGYLWLTTYDGLVRFDGHRFATFASAQSGRRLADLLETPDGLLWLRNDTRRLSSFDGRSFRAWGVADGLPSEDVAALHLDAAGALWALTPTGLAVREGGRFRTVYSEPALQGQTQALPLPGGEVLVAANTGLHRWDGAAPHRIWPASGAAAQVQALAIDAAGRVWIGASGRTLLRHPDGRIEAVSRECGPQRIEALAGRVALACGHIDLDADAAGNLVRRDRPPNYGITGGERLLGQAPDGSLWRNRIDVLERDGHTVFAAPCEIRDFRFDRTGAVWVATACEGLVRLRPRRIGALTELSGVPLGAVYGLAQGRDGALWIGTLQHGVAVLSADGAVRWLRGEHGLLPAGFHSIFVGGDGETWIGSCRVDLHAWRCETPEDWPPALGRGDEVRAVHRARDGSLWIGGLSLWRRMPGGQWRQAEAWPGRDDASQVRTILETADGTLWFGTRGRGVLRRDAAGNFRVFTLDDGLSSNAIRALREDRDGQVWIATEDSGLCRWGRDDQSAAVEKPPENQGAPRSRSAAFANPRSPIPHPERISCLDRRHGLWSDSLHQIVFDAGDRAYINSNQGAFAVPRAALDAVLDGAASRVHPQVFTERDGLPDREGNGGVQGAGLLLRDGRIAFPTQHGVALLDPAGLNPASLPARAVIESLDLPGGRSFPGGERIELPRGERSFTLHYTGLSPLLTEPLYFRYRLLPETRWQDLGDARQLSLSRLAPGEHVVELEAFDSEGEAGPAARLTLALPPYFYETTAFRVALPLLLLALAALWLLRQRRLAIERRRELERTVDARTAELRGALDALSAQRNEIARLAMSRTRFFANVSHELRTPLTLISGPLRDAAHGAPLDAHTQHLMLGNAQRLERLVAQLLDLERIDAGRFPLRPGDSDIAALAQETVDAFGPLAAQQRIELRSRIGADALNLHIDADQIARIFGNLLSNALKFTPAEGRIVVTLERGQSQVRIVVADSGPGVPEDWRERIFDRFAQVGSEATRSREGAGLGLAVCREIAQLHGGRLWVEDNEGGGARFVLELPRIAVAQERPSSALPGTFSPPAGRRWPEGPDEGQTSPHSPTRRVLVAEDHPDLRAYIVSILRVDHEVIAAEDGEIALQLARKELPDLIVSDVMMPRRDGFSLARELRATPETAGIPLIFLTARAAVEDEIAGLSSGADQYLKKPFDAALLRAHVAAALHAVERLRRRFASATAVAEPGLPGPNVGSGPEPSGFDDAPEPGKPGPTNAISAAEKRFLANAQAWLQSHLHDETATVQAMAEALHVSRHTLARRYGQLTGQSPSDALRRLRLERARELLAAGEGNVSEVAYAVGYASLAAFSNAYRERYGHAPSQSS